MATDPESLAQISGDPSLYAQRLDLANRMALFVRLSAADYRQASFLDDRVLAPNMPRFTIALSDLHATLAHANAPPRPLHFIFHAGHTGSTLVSRLIEGAGGVLALREPLPLRTLAEAHDLLNTSKSLVSQGEFESLVQTQIKLWSRGFDDTEAVVLKATSTASRIGPYLLDRVPAARAIYLHLKPDSYLTALLAGANSITDLRGFAPERIRRLQSMGVAIDTPIDAMSAGELAGLAWAAERISQRKLEHSGGARVLSVDFDNFLAEPQTLLVAIFAHFGLSAPVAYFNSLAQNPAWSRYSKAPDLAYSPADREYLLTESKRAHAGEIAKGMRWIEATVRRAAAAELLG